MSERDQLAALILVEIDKTSHRFPQESDCLRAADALLAAGWRPPLPSAPDCDHHVWTRDDDPRCVNCGVGCEHRMIVHGGACGNCGQMPPPPTEEEIQEWRQALAKVFGSDAVDS